MQHTPLSPEQADDRAGQGSRRRQLARRELLAAAVAAVPASLASTASATGTRPELTVGVSTLGFHELSNAELAKELAGAGIRTVQLFLNQTDSRYWKYNGRSDVSSLTRDRCKEIAATYGDAGITLHSLGVYTNLIHPDPKERQANLDYFAAMMRIGQQMGIHRLITEAGHYHDPSAPAPTVPYCFQEPVWHEMVATGKQLAQLADRFQTTVLLEPFYRGFLASAKRTRLFIEAVNSPRIRALLDPANLLEVNDLQEMFGQLKPWIDCLHAKDRKLHVDRGVPAGQGDVDYDQLVRLAATHTPQAPLILEYVGSGDYRQSLQHLQRSLQRL